MSTLTAIVLVSALLLSLKVEPLPGFAIVPTASSTPFKVVRGNGMPVLLVPYQASGGSGSCNFGWWRELLGVTTANENGLDGKGVKVLVIDSGVDEKVIEEVFGRKVDWYYNASYEAWKGQCKDYKFFNRIKYCILDEENIGWRKVYYAVPVNSTTDAFGHGTAVASMILSIAPNVTLYVAKVGIAKIITDPNGTVIAIEYTVDPISLSYALYYATAGPDGKPNTQDDPDVVNMSLGAITVLPQPGTVDLVGDLLTYYFAKLPIDMNSGRMVFVAAAGNSKENIPATPAIFPDVIAVSAVKYSNGTFVPAFFTNKGLGIDFAGIGSGVYLPVPINSSIAKLILDPCAKKGKYYVMVRLDGTSFAAPMVTGIVALYLQAGARKSDVVKLMARNVIDVPPQGKDWETGYGVPKAPQGAVGSDNAELVLPLIPFLLKRKFLLNFSKAKRSGRQSEAQ